METEGRLLLWDPSLSGLFREGGPLVVVVRGIAPHAFNKRTAAMILSSRRCRRTKTVVSVGFFGAFLSVERLGELSGLEVLECAPGLPEPDDHAVRKLVDRRSTIMIYGASFNQETLLPWLDRWKYYLTNGTIVLWLQGDILPDMRAKTDLLLSVGLTPRICFHISERSNDERTPLLFSMPAASELYAALRLDCYLVLR